MCAKELKTIFFLSCSQQVHKVALIDYWPFNRKINTITRNSILHCYSILGFISLINYKINTVLAYCLRLLITILLLLLLWYRRITGKWPNIFEKHRWTLSHVWALENWFSLYIFHVQCYTENEIIFVCSKYLMKNVYVISQTSSLNMNGML